MKPNYSASLLILEEIKKARSILLNVHIHPDLDTVGSATAVYAVLTKMGKQVDIVSPGQVSPFYNFINCSDKINQVDFFKINFTKYDLFLILDSGSYDRVTGSKDKKLPESLKAIVIDHHKTNNFRLPLQLVDENASSTSEILFKLFIDWGVEISPEIATSLLAGIAGDTVFFKYVERGETFKIIADLINKGADQKKIVGNVIDSLDPKFVSMLGRFLDGMKVEESASGRFVWAALSYEIYEDFGQPEGVRETAADWFFRSLKDVGFGLAMLETEKGVTSISFRSKPEVDVSAMAEKLGGGGHKNAAGATRKGEFNTVVREVIKLISG